MIEIKNITQAQVNHLKIARYIKSMQSKENHTYLLITLNNSGKISLTNKNSKYQAALYFYKVVYEFSGTNLNKLAQKCYQYSELLSKLTKIAQTLDIDFKKVYANNRLTLNNSYFLYKIIQICKQAPTLDIILYKALTKLGIHSKQALIKAVQAISNNRGMTEEEYKIFNELIDCSNYKTPFPIANKIPYYVKVNNNKPYNISAKDIGTILHKFLPK